MSISQKIREQIINSFRAELAEHIQTLNDGLLAIEQNAVQGNERVERLATIFRAAHSLKGAARAVGVTAIEQLAHALEDVLGALQKETLTPTPELFTACYQAVDAIQLAQSAYEEGKTAPPPQVLQAIMALDEYRPHTENKAPVDETPQPEEALQPPPKLPSAKPAIPGLEKKTLSPTSQSVAAAHGQDETIRVNVSKLDSLMAQLSELLVTKIHAEQRLTQVRAAQQFVMQWQKEWLGVRSAYAQISRQRMSGDTSGTRLQRELDRIFAYLERNQEYMREMTSMMNGLVRDYNSDTMQMGLVIDSLEEEIKRVRMLPFNTITGSFGRMVRDMAQGSEKNAVLEIVGANVELDKRVLEQIKDPITHLLRNAIDHGIEKTTERVKAGKPEQARIVLSVQSIGKDVIITVSDDGAGINVEAIRQTALRRGVASAISMNEGELVELLFTPGFSTSPIITDVSGRGVGLDVVRRNVENLRGRINVEWKVGEGSQFSMTLPLTLTSSRALLVSVSGQLFAIPLNAIERISQVQQERIETVGGHDTIRSEGRPLMLVHLGDVLGLPRTNTQIEDGRIPIVVLSSTERHMAFAVDRLADEQEVVIKNLGRQLLRVGGISGVSVMGNGDVVLVLNVSDLIKLAQRGVRRSVREQTENVQEQAPQVRVRRILVVDDSITTRTLEKNILEAAGYSVQLATDGQEALNAMLGELPDIVISDVQMPRIDGFQLTARIKQEARTAHLPVILVTSMDSAEYKTRGIEAGADAYIVKQHFDQNNLLETIEQLI